jgi:hypothetical protein
MTQDLGVENLAVKTGRAATEKLFVGQELLVDLQAGLEADRLIVLGRHLGERLEAHIGFRAGRAGRDKIHHFDKIEKRWRGPVAGLERPAPVDICRGLLYSGLSPETRREGIMYRFLKRRNS